MKNMFVFGFCISENVVEIISHLTALKQNADNMPAITTDKNTIVHIKKTVRSKLDTQSVLMNKTKLKI